MPAKVSFSAKVRIIGVNPYVSVPRDGLELLFRQAGRRKGPIPVRGRLDGKPFRQTLVKYSGAWRLYLNGAMREAAGIDVGDVAHVEVSHDPRPRPVPVRPEFARALRQDRLARAAFDRLPPSRRKEILRYLASMKTQESVDRNVERIIGHLRGRDVKVLRPLFRLSAQP